MTRASRLFSEEDKQAVKAAIAEAEKKTSGEIVPVVATRSGRYDRAEDLFGVILGLVAVAVVWLLFQKIVPKGGDWEIGQTMRIGLGTVLLTFAIAFIVGAAVSTWVPAIAHFLVPRREMRQEVQRAADEAFVKFRVRGTKAATGVLIYVSLFERMVWVVGDQAISEKLEQSHWHEAKDLVLDGLRRGKPAEGLCAAIQKCGEHLARHFPIAPNDVNELSNELQLIG